MPRSPASRKPQPPKAEEPKAKLPPLRAVVPPEIVPLLDEPASPEEEAAVLAWIRGEGPDPWADSD
ncbi:MAG: hypothetical protein HYY06_01560 [Deltaproteobacteria bacterium]|nr:hypothetical protein [Deltaproteobacteria bacterium]